MINETAIPKELFSSIGKCNIETFELSQESIITSSGLCYLCKWDQVDGVFTLSSQLDLASIYDPNSGDGCTLNEMVLKESSLYLTKKYNVNNNVDILKVKASDLTFTQKISKTVRQPRSSVLVFS